MKLDQLKIPTLKPRDPNQAILASKKNAGGAMRDKKQEWKRGEMKHRGRAYEELLESLEDNQAELAGEFDTLIAKAKRDGWKSDRIAQYKKQFDALNRNFASAYYNDDSDGDNDGAIESVLDSMEELLDELADELGELREGVEPRKSVVTEKFHLGDAPEAKGKFKELGVEALAAWLIKTRDGDARRIYGSINQQIIFNGKKDPEYAKKMKSVRETVKRKLDKKKKD